MSNILFLFLYVSFCLLMSFFVFIDFIINIWYYTKQVLPHVDVCMAVRFLRRVDCSSDYIDLSLTFREILEKEVLLMLTIHCVRLFTVLVICMESMTPRRKNNRPLSWQNIGGYPTIKQSGEPSSATPFMHL